MLAQRGMLAKRGVLGRHEQLSALELNQHKWLYVAVAVGLFAVILAIAILSRGDKKHIPAPAAQPPEHVVEFKPPPSAETSPPIEVKPAESPSIDIVRPEELDVEKRPNSGPSQRSGPASPPQFKPSRYDYGI